MLDVAVYDDIRTHPNRFVVVPGHEILEIDHVVATHEAFTLVEKAKDVGFVVKTIYAGAHSPV